MFKNLQEECYEANMMLPKLNLVVFTFGNASVVDRSQGLFAIKPSGVPYEVLHPSDIVICDFEGRVVMGDKRPSSDTKTHAVLFQNWTDVGGIVHTHSTYATAWAQAQRDIPILGTTHADYLTVDIPCAPPMDDAMIQGDYERETGFQILNEFERRNLSPSEVEMVLLGNHAPFTWGKTAEKAVYNAGLLEAIAQMAYLSCTLRPDVPRLKQTLIDKHYFRKHGKDAYYGQGC
ncbi:L-ribulose-5-phosphate 4-epimerase [Siphonobacter aquaeclarae]|uniref:L-ribulose-5-phosphate 4-epimerase n=1 Tax=Siphonobacter aquaeclarae TaxID=563176 RepID=A0A1G9Q2K2_9BACT|nr:L-ribulose-5-phosphate 4-epimerase [Siphonobacter aquaeclarae]SDM05282.1 L-ribulose 5-phosphate 4-epimerase [Siphonobacter aquaeclarae]